MNAMKVLQPVILAFAMVSTIAVVQAQVSKVEEDSLGHCAVSLRIPQFSSTSPGESSLNPISVLILVGANGAPSDIRYENSAIKEHRDAIQEAFEKSTFKRECNGKRVRLLISFKVQGDKSYGRFTRVEFRPPNHFVTYITPYKPRSE